MTEQQQSLAAILRRRRCDALVGDAIIVQDFPAGGTRNYFAEMLQTCAILADMQTAEEYLAHRLSVIPLNGKRPTTDWKEYQARLATLDEVRQWGRCNIGLVTGAVSGITVVDCDTRDDAVWFYRQHRTPMICKTGKGIHLYYRGSLVGNRAKVLSRQIDVRGNGGYVVAPPSFHQSGRKYEWAIPEWEFNRAELPEFDPDWIGGVESQTVYSTSQKVRDGIAYISKIHAVSGQGGHSATFRAAIKLVESGLSEVEAFAALVDWNRTNCQPPWTTPELMHKLHDAVNTVLERASQQLALMDDCPGGVCSTGGDMRSL